MQTQFNALTKDLSKKNLTFLGEPSFWPLKNLSKTLNWGCLQKLDLQILKTDQVTAILSLKKKIQEFS